VARGSGAAAAAVTRLQWVGPRRSPAARRAAQAAASGVATEPATTSPAARSQPAAPAWASKPFNPSRDFDELVAAAEAALPRPPRRPSKPKTKA